MPTQYVVKPQKRARIEASITVTKYGRTALGFSSCAPKYVPYIVSFQANETDVSILRFRYAKLRFEH